jgi:pyrroloquinoline quinone biosynthesis protein E
MVETTEHQPGRLHHGMVPNPLALIAEVTHRCPLHCVYCSNPLELAGAKAELSTAEWTSVFQQCGKLGMLHAHFTGGEPLARADLTELISAARAAGLYTNLITSGIGLNEQRLQTLVSAGLDHIRSAFRIRGKKRRTGLRGRRRTRTRSNCRGRSACTKSHSP